MAKSASDITQVLKETLRDTESSLMEVLPTLPSYPLLVEPDTFAHTRLGERLRAANSAKGRAIEELLNELSVLLDRCLAERNEKFTLELAGIEFALEHRLHQRQHEIRKRQEKNKLYVINRDVAKIRREAAKVAIENHKRVVDRAIDAYVARPNDVYKSDEEVYRHDGGSEKTPADRMARLRQLAKDRTEKSTEVAFLSAYKQPDAIRDHAYDLSKVNITYESINAALAVATAEQEAGRLASQVDVESELFDFENSNWEDVRALYQAEVEWHETRAAIAKVEGTALNYTERLEAIQKLYDADLVAAYGRAKALESGFDYVLGGEREPLPQPSDRGFFTALVLWTRARIEEWSAFTDNEVNSTITISLYAVATASEQGDEAKRRKWEQLIAGGAVSFHMAFPMLGNPLTMRIRSVHAYVDCRPTSDGLWKLKLIPPEEKSVLYFGNAGRRSSDLPRSTSDAKILRNMKPEGEWTVHVLGQSTRGEFTEIIGDIQLDLALSVTMGGGGR